MTENSEVHPDQVAEIEGSPATEVRWFGVVLLIGHLALLVIGAASLWRIAGGWWVGVLALLVVLWWWLVRRDWRAGAIAAGFVGGYLPWFFYQDRTIYTFYAVAFVPYIVLALTFALGLLIGDPSSSPDRRRIGVAIAGVFVLAIVAVSWFYWPVWVADVIPYSSWRNRMWFPSWI